MQVRWVLVLLLMAAVSLAVTGCSPAAESSETMSAPVSPTASPDNQPTAPSAPTVDAYAGWTSYTNPNFGLSFRYPTSWFGPEVYENSDAVRIEVGSDTVYPYGTSLDERQPGAPNAYSIVIQYTRNSSGWTMEQYRAEQPWFSDYLAVLGLQDGESLTSARSLTTRVRGLTVDRFTGVEFTTTLSETAQTERFFMRTAFLMDEDLNVLVISGSPNNVEVSDPATWRAAFEAVDAANLGTFRALVNSIVME